MKRTAVRSIIPTSISSVLRLPLHALAATMLALVLTANGLLSMVDTGIRDVTTWSGRVPVGGRTVLVVADADTVQATRRYPYDRGLTARVLDRLGEAGAGRIFVDATLNGIEDPAGDDALEAALARLGPERVALPIQRMARTEIDARPLDRFARHATLLSAEFVLDGDRRSRRLAPLTETNPLPGDWLVGRSRPAGAAQFVDFDFSPRSLPRYEMREVAAGRVPAEAFAGREILVGLDVPHSVFNVTVPIHGPIGRLQYLGLSAETARQPSELRPAPTAPVLLVVFAAALVLGAVTTRIGAPTGAATMIVASGAWFWWFAAIERSLGLLLPPLLPPVALLLVWQVLLVRQSRLLAALRRRIARAVGIGREALLAAVDVMAEPAFVIDRSGRIVGANAPFAQLNGEGAAKGRVEAITDLGLDRAAIIGAAGADATSRFDIELRSPGAATTRVFDTHLRWIDTLAGLHAIAAMKDVTRERALEAELKALAFRDPLTGLANRISFEAALHATGTGDAGVSCAVLLIDLDGFKAVNDTLGHHAGDLLLAGFAGRLSDLLRPDDLPARLGGDEFAVLLRKTGAAGARRLTERLIESLRTPFDVEGAPAQVGASVGIAVWPDHHRDPSEVLKFADAAMYAAKRAKPAYALHTAEGPEVVATPHPSPIAVAAA